MQSVFQDTANAIKNILKYQNYGPNFSGDNFKLYPKDFASKLYTNKIIANANAGSGAPSNMSSSFSKGANDLVFGNQAIVEVSGTWSERLSIPYTVNVMIDTIQSYGKDISDWIKSNGDGSMWTPIFINMSSTQACVKDLSESPQTNFPVEIVFIFVRFDSNVLKWYVGHKTIYLTHTGDSSEGYPIMSGEDGENSWKIEHRYGAGTSRATKVLLTLPMTAQFPNETDAVSYGVWSNGGSIGNTWYIPGFTT